MKYEMTMEITGHYIKKIEANSVEEAIDKANSMSLHELPYNELISAIEETQAILAHDEDGEEVWYY